MDEHGLKVVHGYMGFIQQYVIFFAVSGPRGVAERGARNAEQAVRNMLLKATEQAGTNVLQVGCSSDYALAVTDDRRSTSWMMDRPSALGSR